MTHLAAESPPRAHVTRRSRQRAHPEMLTVPIRGPLAAKMRELAETTGLSLAKLLGDMVLAYEGERYKAATSRGRGPQSGLGGRGTSRPMPRPFARVILR